jgi:hypothetical protein
MGFLEKLFGKKEPEVFTISRGGVPAWLDERRKTARTVLIAETGSPQKKIRDAVLQLQQITVTIGQAEQETELHPKLRSIAKNSLPQFVKAMNASLAKEFSDEIEEFYPAAAECLKSCLNNLRGQGRYLVAVLPEEMKAVRSGIGTIGHEINGITASLARYRKETDLIDSVLALDTAIRDLSEDIGRSEEKDKRITIRIAEITDRLAAIENELKAGEENPQMSEVTALTTAVRDTENRRDASLRTNTALSMTASHVFRKAEKIAARKKNPSEISLLRRTMELLSDHTTPDPGELAAALAASCPIAERMIAAEEIMLKNKEERAVFSDTQQFSTDICASCTDLRSLEDAARIAEENLASHPLRIRARSLEREKAQLETMLEKENQARIELQEWKIRTTDKNARLFEELTKKIEAMVGVGVQFSD